MVTRAVLRLSSPRHRARLPGPVANPTDPGVLLSFDSLRGYSSVGRALDWQSRGQGFESPYLHRVRAGQALAGASGLSSENPIPALSPRDSELIGGWATTQESARPFAFRVRVMPAGAVVDSFRAAVRAASMASAADRRSPG